MRSFNVAGPCVAADHYMLPPEPRLPGARRLIEEKTYFAVHAPRQTGKTTTLWTLARQLTAEGRYAALHFSCETGEPAGDDIVMAQEAVLNDIRWRAELDLPEALRPPPWPDAPDGALLGEALAAWARSCPRPLVLFFDEIDALLGKSLRSVLRQLRARYPSRPASAPLSVVLCGLRDVRDYKAASGGDPSRLGTSSPFNIKTDSLRILDFTEAQLRELYAQHTEDTGQAFTEGALERAWTLSRGQPWLTNALAREIIRNIGVPADESITADHFEDAKERLVLARQTHLDSLVAKLHEARVRRVMEPVLAGTRIELDAEYDDAVRYVRDLGLIAPKNPIRVANPIYREIIARVLSSGAEGMVPFEDNRAFVGADGRLDTDMLLREFIGFWIEHGEWLATRDAYHEAAAQLVLMAYLQRVVNGGGYIDREYGVGRGRVDLLVRWPYEVEGERRWQREAFELKVWRDGEPDPVARGAAQLDGYLDRLGLDTGLLVLFDRREAREPIDVRTRLETATTPSGRQVTLLRA